MSTGPDEGGTDPEEALDPYPQVDPYAQAEAEAEQAAAAEEDQLAIEADRQNAAEDPARGGGPLAIGEILPKVVDDILRRDDPKS